jgi:NTP pyrophosphatase (non-canonical NTP hydrolase)
MMDEKLNTYVKFVRSLEQNDYSIEDCKRLHHALMGLVTEAGELMDILKKHLIYKTPLDNQKLKDELSDVLFYWTQAVDSCGSNLEEIMAINTAKLTKRYPNGFTFKNATDRDTKAEAAIIAKTIEKGGPENILIQSDAVKQAMLAAGAPANEFTVKLKKATDEMMVDGLKSTADIKLKGIVPPPVYKPRPKLGRIIPGIADRDGVRIRLCPNCGMALAEGQICICNLQQGE